MRNWPQHKVEEVCDCEHIWGFTVTDYGSLYHYCKLCLVEKFIDKSEPKLGVISEACECPACEYEVKTDD